MPIVTGAPRLLVKAPAGFSSARLALGATTLDLRAEPLFRSIGQAGPAAVAPAVWHVVTPAIALDEANPWDLCHQLMVGGLGVAGVAPEFAEPDFEQQWITGRPAESAFALAAPCAEPAPQNPQFPGDPDLLWFHDADHAQFEAAVSAIGDPGADRVRVAHLDTGYDPAHLTLPAHLETGLQRNFVEVDRPDDATDVTEGPLNSLGHGTGTLGILAGKALPGDKAIGAAPFVAVVPIRVANSVVLFLNSAIARAFDYVHQLCASPDTQVHVITMSMGGVASQAWAEAVNALYDAGVFIATAAGNNYGNLPTHNIVFPARFRRVVAACGVMADGAAYANLDLSLMAGNYGPPSKMDTAMAAFTPNVPWARIGCPDIVNYDGAGTSSATPQVAAAAATWIQRHKADLAAYPEPWMRVEATRKALFESAHDTSRELLGWGELRAREALDQAPAPSDSLSRQPLDTAAFPILRLFFGQGLAAPDSRQRMLELEALQLSQSAALEQILPDPAVDPARLSQADLVRVANALAEHPGASE